MIHRPPVSIDLMLANRGGMSLIRGIDPDIVRRLPALAKYRIRRVALGRALKCKVAGKHNAAGSWLAIAAQVAQ